MMNKFLKGLVLSAALAALAPVSAPSNDVGDNVEQTQQPGRWQQVWRGLGNFAEGTARVLTGRDYAEKALKKDVRFASEDDIRVFRNSQPPAAVATGGAAPSSQGWWSWTRDVTRSVINAPVALGQYGASQPPANTLVSETGAPESPTIEDIDAESDVAVDEDAYPSSAHRGAPKDAKTIAEEYKQQVTKELKSFFSVYCRDLQAAFDAMQFPNLPKFPTFALPRTQRTQAQREAINSLANAEEIKIEIFRATRVVLQDGLQRVIDMHKRCINATHLAYGKTRSAEYEEWANNYVRHIEKFGKAIGSEDLEACVKGATGLSLNDDSTEELSFMGKTFRMRNASGKMFFGSA